MKSDLLIESRQKRVRSSHKPLRITDHAIFKGGIVLLIGEREVRGW